MKFITFVSCKARMSKLLLATSAILLVAGTLAAAPLRRPVSPNQPMYLVHIDTWNYADPQKIIDLVPEDIRPYVVMNISLSISHNVETSRFQVAEYGYEIAKSWLRTCAQNRMWAVVQIASGGFSQFSDHDLSVYNELYRDYPNLIGINYAEQFWGYDDPSDPLSPKWMDRINHFANLLELSHRYGGYVFVSWCGNQWSPPINPIGMLKRSPAFAKACETYTENFLLFEKYTQTSYQSDMESICLGSYLSGYSGGYGIRYDDTGWSDATGEHANFSMATGAAVHLEHMMLTGSTMIDGPELIWTQCFRETGRQSTTSGYSKRNWETFPQFINVTVDAFRKILDGTVRIPTRKEVIDRTKYVIINDVNTGNNDDIYSSPSTLFEGLYRMDGDGNLANNKSFFKKTGRYPTIPTVYNLNDSLAKTFPFQIKKSTYGNRWSTISSKVQEFDGQFPAEYTGTLYAGRHENGWVLYNPFKTGVNAAASIPFKYNTCERVEVTMTQYTAGVMKEYADKLSFYLNNFDNFINLGMRNTVIKVYGSSVKPTITYKDRGNHQASVVTEAWSEGVYTLTVTHNGPLDIDITNCAGTATGRLTAYTEATLVRPAAPPVYTGPRQYEAECFDYKYISGITTGGQYGSIRNYTGQGYLKMGTNAGASVRDTVTVLRAGKYTLETRYAVTGGNVTSLDLLVNGIKVATPIFRASASESDWKVDSRTINLNAGANEIVFRGNRTGSYNLVLDNIVVTEGVPAPVYAFNNETATDSATTPAAEYVTVLSGSAGVAQYTDNSGLANKGFKTYSTGSLNGTGVAELNLFPDRSGDYSLVWKACGSTEGSKMGILLRASGEAGSCAYAQGLKQGYLFIVHQTADQRLLLKPYVAGVSGLTAQATHTSSFTVPTNTSYWLRASAYGTNLVFECSSDSLNWEGAESTAFTDASYIVGGTQLVWGLNSDNYSGFMDNLTLLESQLSTSVLKLANLTYTQGHGPSANGQFTVAAGHLYDTLELRSSNFFELSLTPQGDFDSVVYLSPAQVTAGDMPVYVRMKAGLAIGNYQGTLSLKSGLASSPSIDLSGSVTPSPETRRYHFEYDQPSTVAQTPPASYVSIGNGSTTTAGVVRYSDSRAYTSNMLKPYSGGQRNATGTLNLNRFSKTATDYSVTWRQAIHSGTSDTKIGVLLRGNPNKVGDGSTGYVQGMMQGYLFIVYNANTGTPRTEFRIYRSTETYNQLNMMTNSTAASFASSAKQSLWYRASVSGSGPVSLKFEYSSDSINWTTGAQASDNGVSVFQAGATQLAWGLGVGDVNFFMDDICFEGVESATGAKEDAITVSVSSLANFTYMANNGPSTAQSFVVSGSGLVDDIHLEAPAGYELSRSIDTGYSPYLALTRTGSDVAATTVYARLKAGLTQGDYVGTINVSAISAIGQSIAVAGVVTEDPNALDRPTVSAYILSQTYYNLAGQPLVDQPVTDGLYLVKTVYSDGKVVVEKIEKP